MTPVQQMSKTLKIDGRDFRARRMKPSSTSRGENDIFIPTLCRSGRPFGRRRLPACAWSKSRAATNCCPPASPVEEGMEVTDQLGAAAEYRQMILELLFTERNHVCSVCVSNGHCELQSWRRSSVSLMCAFRIATPKRKWTPRTTFCH